MCCSCGKSYYDVWAVRKPKAVWTAGGSRRRRAVRIELPHSHSCFWMWLPMVAMPFGCPLGCGWKPQPKNPTKGSFILMLGVEQLKFCQLSYLVELFSQSLEDGLKLGRTRVNSLSSSFIILVPYICVCLLCRACPILATSSHSRAGKVMRRKVVRM